MAKPPFPSHRRRRPSGGRADATIPGLDARRAALRLLDAVLRRGEPLETALHAATQGLADRADFVDVVDPEVNAPWTDRLTQPIIGVILMMGEIFLPAADERRRDRLGADVHQPPLVQSVVL